MKIAEIKNIETKELVEKLEAAVDALNKKKINHNVTPLENPSEIKVARRDIARMKTELRQREQVVPSYSTWPVTGKLEVSSKSTPLWLIEFWLT